MLSFKRLIEDKYKDSLEAEIKLFCEQDSKLFLKANYLHQNCNEA